MIKRFLIALINRHAHRLAGCRDSLADRRYGEFLDGAMNDAAGFRIALGQ
jgi:hypothetical protein